VVTDVLAALRTLIAEERLGAVVTLVEGPDAGRSAVIAADEGVVAGSVPEEIAGDLLEDAGVLMEHEQNRSLRYGERRVFLETVAPRPRLLVVGAGAVAEPLTAMARLMGYHVTVADPRPAFTTADRFPDADEVMVGWPADLDLRYDRRTYVVVLSHDARIEDALLPQALESPARYIGAMGSRRTHAKRLERLRGMGFGTEVLERIHGPVGLDIGAESPSEVAVSILAEMTLARYGAGTGKALRGRDGRIHLQKPGDGDV
jgi:xanthine dehydrogenase accessory factor